MSLVDLLASDRIVVLDDADDRLAVLDAAARLLADQSSADAVEIASSLRAREQLGSTAIGHGVAIPHGRTDAYERARGAFLRLRTPVDFDACDRQPVDLVFAMAVPRHFTQQHLQMLSELAGQFGDEGFRSRLRDADDTATLRALLLDGDDG